MAPRHSGEGLLVFPSTRKMCYALQGKKPVLDKLCSIMSYSAIYQLGVQY